MTIRGGSVLPLCIYGGTAILCLLMPVRLAVHDDAFTSAVNTVPTNACAMAAIALCIVHVAFGLSGRLAVTVAACWATATAWMAMLFAVVLYEPNRWTWAAIYLIGTLAVGSSAVGLIVIAWQMARRRIAMEARLIPRGLAAMGLAMLGITYGLRTPRTLGPFGPAIPLEQLAADTAELGGSLWIISGVLLVGAIAKTVWPHGLESRRSDPRHGN